MSYPVAFANSLLVTVVALAVLTIFPAMLGYYLARWDAWKARITRAVPCSYLCNTPSNPSPARFTWDEAAQVAHISLPMLADLLDRSLLVREVDQVHYAVPEMGCRYAARVDHKSSFVFNLAVSRLETGDW